MSVSVIIPHRNLRPEFLKEARESVEKQTMKPLEVIEETGKFENKFNNAIKKAKGEFILILSDDDMLAPDFIEKTYEAAIKNQVDIVSTFIKCFGTESGIHGPERFPFFSSLFRKTLWEKIGGFDHSMLQMTDVDFWVRALDSGARWHKLYEPFYYYRKHPGQDSVTADWDKARKLFIKKHGYIL